ncbi:MAG: hypothetical protein JW730_06030 [Anaerolineales bacterium]|nr:hypothetical protein [Anaerolineales bacterium]
MKKISLLIRLADRKTKLTFLFLALLLLWLGLNYRQLYSAWVVRSETQRLVNLAAKAPSEFQNPPPAEDHFDGELSPDFWEFTTINGGGEVSNGMAWHSAAMALDQSLTLQHFPDPSFKDESSDWHVPAADQYNNVSLIGGSGFRPSASRDVVLKFTMRVSEGFYGSAGVIFQPVGTLREDGLLSEQFDMFGFVVMGEESLVMGHNGPLCYLALSMIMVQVEPLQVDVQSLHTYEIRLHWIDQTEWLGSLKVDGVTQSQIPMPAFGPVEVHVWSDNGVALYRPRRWWEIGPVMDMKYQDGGEKQVDVEMIQIFEEER